MKLTKSNLKEMIKEVLNEGPAYEYAKDVKQIEKTEKLKGKPVNKLVEK